MTKPRSKLNNYPFKIPKRRTHTTSTGKTKNRKTYKKILLCLMNIFDLMQFLDKHKMLVTNISNKNMVIVCDKTKHTLKFAKQLSARATNKIWSVRKQHIIKRSKSTSIYSYVSPPERIILKMINDRHYATSTMERIKRALYTFLGEYILSYNLCMPTTVSPLSFESVKNMEVDIYTRMVKEGMTEHTELLLCENYNVFVMGMIIYNTLDISNIMHENIDLYDDLVNLATGMTRIHSKQRPVICAAKQIYIRILQQYSVL